MIASAHKLVCAFDQIWTFFILRFIVDPNQLTPTNQLQTPCSDNGETSEHEREFTLSIS